MGVRPNVFCQHRNHDILCAFGADMTKVRDELLGLETGTTHGLGGDPCHHDQSAQYGKIWGHIGLVGDQVPIAVGMAYATNEWSVCFLGDATVEEDNFWPSVGFAVTHKLPVLFVELDNGLSVITRREVRRLWDSQKVAVGFGCAAETVMDHPVQVAAAVELISNHRPVYLRVLTNRRYRHVGAGTDGPVVCQMEHYRQEMYGKYGDKARAIESAAILEMERIWQT
jgi:pyruvate dehydrogenase E1 component alpha subunit